MTGKIKYEFSGKPWQHNATNGWYFISIPTEMAEEIRNELKSEEEGWGRLKALAKIRSSEWKTAIWFDTKMKTYLLPLKSEIRKRENIKVGDVIDVAIWL